MCRAEMVMVDGDGDGDGDGGWRCESRISCKCRRAARVSPIDEAAKSPVRR